MSWSPEFDILFFCVSLSIPPPPPPPLVVQYLIVKDPNKPVMRIYSIPQDTFENESDDDDDDDSDDADDGKMEDVPEEKAAAAAEGGNA